VRVGRTSEFNAFGLQEKRMRGGCGALKERFAEREVTAMERNWQNKLYFGDNLEILRDHVGDESVDLIYLDPPFNSKATYSVLFKEKRGE